MLLQSKFPQAKILETHLRLSYYKAVLNTSPKLLFYRTTTPNKRMHATCISAAVNHNLVGGRVMRGVMRFSSCRKRADSRSSLETSFR